jgi:hypothetical protein
MPPKENTIPSWLKPSPKRERSPSPKRSRPSIKEKNQTGKRSEKQINKDKEDRRKLITQSREKKMSSSSSSFLQQSWDTGIDFRADSSTKCKEESKNNYIVSFGFEYERKKYFVFWKDNNTWRNFVLTDGRFKQKFYNKKYELLEISADSSRGLILEKEFGIPDNISFEPELKDYEDGIITFNNTSLSRQQNRYDFDYLECIYTVKNLDKEINLDCLVKYDTQIRNVIQKYFTNNYEEEKTIYGMKLDNEVRLKTKIYKPKYKVNIPWIMCRYKDKDTCPKLDDMDWDTQATVGIKFGHAVNFMKDLFDKYETIFSTEKKVFDFALNTSNACLTDNTRPKVWFVLKIFYLYMDITRLINISKEYERLDISETPLNSDIENEYKEWLKKSSTYKDSYVSNNHDIRRYVHRQFMVSKLTTSFQIRHSLNHILYELNDKNPARCITFLKDMKKKIEELFKDSNSYLKSYFITDFTKGILYFEGLKTSTTIYKDFKKYNDPDLSIEKNYGYIRMLTKYRIKAYDYSKNNDVYDKNGVFSLKADTLLFELRSYQFIKDIILKNP